MYFRSEAGFYYYFYKTIATAPSFSQGLHKLYRNNVTEFPNTINALNRFNLYPEVFIGGLFRIFKWITTSLNINTITCWRIKREYGLKPVESCDGLGNLTVFYVEFAWLAAGLTMAMMFGLGYAVSDGNIFGGLLSVLCYFYNHGQCTRIMWFPPLRETFGYPLWLVQMFSVTMVLKGRRSRILDFTLITSSILFIIVWQFSQFILFTQSLAIFFLSALNLVDKDLVMHLIKMLMMCLGTAFLFTFGNLMLITSWLFASLMSSIVIITKFDHMKVNDMLGYFAPGLRAVLMLMLTISIKEISSLMLLVQDDAHVGNILKSKFTSYRDFHTDLYTCAGVFDFIGLEMPIKTSRTLLIPGAIFAVILIIIKVLRQILDSLGVSLKYHLEQDCLEPSKKTQMFYLNPVTAYHMMQLVIFGFMALIIMRLKLLFTPQLCVTVGFLCAYKYIPMIKSKLVHIGFLALLVGCMSVTGIENLAQQHSISGQFSNPYLEELIEWINAKLPKDESFAIAGRMDQMASILLSTGCPVVNHPHYEDASLRERTKEIYKLYSRRTPEEYHKIIAGLGAKYLVLDYRRCFESGGCSARDSWDREEPERVGKLDFLCPKLFASKRPLPFKRVFSNAEFVLLKV